MNKAGPRGNVAKVQRDAKRIARRYLAGEISIMALMAEYHVAYGTLMRVLERHTTTEQRDAVKYARLVKCGRKNRFRKGHPTWNKGRKGWCSPGSRATQFKPGQMRGAAARNWRPVGTVVIRYDKPPRHLRGRKRKAGLPPWRGPGRRFIKVSNFGRPQDRWLPYARWLWAKLHGPVPAGMNVVHVDGDMLNDSPANLRLLDDRGRLALQAQRDPGFMERAHKAAGVTARLRGQRTRGAKRERGPVFVRWQCPGCGNHADQKVAPDRCSKCGGQAFEKLQLQAAG